MDIKFPEQENPFPKTMAVAVISAIAALLIGMFLGNALGALFGTDESVINTSTYTDNMAAVKTMFTDADQLDSYMNTALNFVDMDGLRLYSSRDRQKMLAYYNGEYIAAEELFGDDVCRSLKEMMNTEDALYGLESSTGGPIENVRLFNVAVEDQTVYYYLYYHDAGYIGIAYDHNEDVIGTDNRNAMLLTANDEGDKGLWYLMYALED